MVIGGYDSGFPPWTGFVFKCFEKESEETI